MKPKQLAIISDIHANVHALEAVLADIEARGVPEVLCLGDMVGYGGSPRECISVIQSHPLIDDKSGIVIGNHDYAALNGANGFSPRAAGAIEWTKEQLSDDDKEWLASLEENTLRVDSPVNYELAHACLVEPHHRHYILSWFDAWVYGFALMEHPVLFVGHTHVPKIWYHKREDPWQQDKTRFDRPKNTVTADGKDYTQIPQRYSLAEHDFMIINVGSAGQPRDGNPDACYALVTLDKEFVEVVWPRVQYDVEGAAAAIEKADYPYAELNGYRLLNGR